MEYEWKERFWTIQMKISEGDWVDISYGNQSIKFGNKESAEGARNTFVENYGTNPDAIRVFENER